jgi:hypothetical protein
MRILVRRCGRVAPIARAILLSLLDLRDEVGVGVGDEPFEGVLATDRRYADVLNFSGCPILWFKPHQTSICYNCLWNGPL